MKKFSINTATVEVELHNGAMWFHSADWGTKANGWKPTLVGLSWSAPCKWFSARWIVYKTAGDDRLCRDFESLPEAFRFFKSLLK